MKQPKTGFYMGVKGLTEDGKLIAFENTYGPIRTVFIAACYITGACVIGSVIGQEVTKGIGFIKVKIKEHRHKKDLESN